MRKPTPEGDSPRRVRNDDVRPNLAPCDFECPAHSSSRDLVVASDYALPEATLTLLASIVVDQAERLKKKTEAA